MKFEPLVPWWGLLILLVPFFVWLIWLIVLKVRKKTKRSTTWLLRCIGIVICFTAIAVGPSLPGERSPAGVINLDVVIVIDRTPSVSAEDYDGKKPRLEGVKTDLLALIDKMKGARIALITFDSSARLNVPFTSDSSASAMAIKILDQEMSGYSKGSSIDLPVDVAVKMLTQSKQKYPDRGRLFFYAGDGEQTADRMPKSFSTIKPLVSGGAVLGYGTTAGGKMKTYYGFQDITDKPLTEYVEDYSDYSANGYSAALSKIDETNLQTIAQDVGVPYIHRTSPSQPLSDIVNASNLQVVADTHREILHYVSLYWIFAIILAALFAWWLLELSGAIREGIRKEARS